MTKLDKLENKQAELIKKAREIWDKQFGEDRELTDKEYSEYKKLMGKIEKLDEQIKEEQRLQKLEESLTIGDSMQTVLEQSKTIDKKDQDKQQFQQSKKEQEIQDNHQRESKQKVDQHKKEQKTQKEKQQTNEENKEIKDQNKQKDKQQVKKEDDKASKQVAQKEKEQKAAKSATAAKDNTNHRAWIMGIDETKEDKKDEPVKEEQLGKETTENIKEEVIAPPENNDAFGNGRGRYSLLSRLSQKKKESSLETTEDRTTTKTKINKENKDNSVKTKEKSSNEDQFRELKNRLHRTLIDEIDKETLQNNEDNKDLEKEVVETVESLLDKESESLSSKEREKIVDEILNETLGFGPITPLIEDENVSEIMVNGPDQVYVEEEGKLKLTDVNFRDEQHVLHVIEKIVAPLGRRIDESSPMVDARLPDGSRVNAIIPPLSLTGPTLTIRKFSEDPLEAKDLITFGSMSTEMSEFLKTCVRKRLNVIVSGGTGSGKTTTLNVLSSFIPKDERIVTIEDAAELTLHQDHVVTLETRPPNMEGKGAITMRDLVRNSLRMRPDRIVVGEVRGGEALDMLQAMNTGHDGSLTTGHANSPRDMLSRLETMVLMAGMDLPIRAIREQIASAIDLIVHQDRLEDGTRKIVKVSEVQGMEGDVITMQDLFTFKRKGRDKQNKIVGEFESTGFTSVFLERLENQ